MCVAAARQPIPVDTLRPLIARVAEKWFELKGRARILPRAGFAPKDFVFALNHLCIVDVRPDVDVVFRLCGTAISSLIGRELTGLSLRSVTKQDDWPYRLSVFNQVLKGSAFIGQHKVQLANGAAHESQELILPFAEIADDGSGQALIVNDFVRPEYPSAQNCQMANCLSQRVTNSIRCDDQFFQSSDD